MSRFYLPPDQCRDSTLFLAGREAHHALHVLRIQRGQQVTVLDGAGHEFTCEVQGFDRDKIELSLLEKRTIAALPYQITLLQALPKGKLFESIVQKATELGVFRIVPLIAERVVPQLEEKRAANKTSKWQMAAIEAIKQCGSPWLPRLEEPVTPAQFLARGEKFDLPLIAALDSGTKHPRDHFRAFHARHDRLPESICVWIGPEGDFTPFEYSSIKASGALPITLGPFVLRTETAAVYSLSVLNYELRAV
jgi:16S rRNA (uracil1498-N3)-methyltransferase